MNNNNTHYPEDLGYKNGLEKALKALRNEREAATEKMMHHIDKRNQYEGNNKIEFNHHSERYTYYYGQQEALLDAVNAMKRMLKNA